MRHNLSGRKLNRTSSHRKALLMNLSNALIKHEQITTTLPKAKELRPFVEKLITLGKKGDLQSRKKAISILNEKKNVKKLFDIFSKRYEKRKGGYTRIVKLLNRYGDNAATAVIELVDRDIDAKGKDSGPIQVKKKQEEDEVPQQ
ncbi:MAG: 50S ribosomal protein L17 [Alphaproteobacteria bacterium MarineAlpha5_Bin12]|nr:50S ribosomal protein L17 [Pelagibacteraceae bacterium]PPR42089.1 MAG: 50S ribosomal protein L17 [Alphaproteobacteria bacterium MarineAlpha5_Bin12]|tara:strand:- start:205 stop:639 length:435 start_codon:yes stop_codon:yes gene_type:complete